MGAVFNSGRKKFEKTLEKQLSAIDEAHISSDTLKSVKQWFEDLHYICSPAFNKNIRKTNLLLGVVYEYLPNWGEDYERNMRDVVLHDSWEGIDQIVYDLYRKAVTTLIPTSSADGRAIASSADVAIIVD